MCNTGKRTGGRYGKHGYWYSVDYDEMDRKEAAKRKSWWFAPVLAAVTLTMCGGGGDDGDTPRDPTGRKVLVIDSSRRGGRWIRLFTRLVHRAPRPLGA